MYIMNSFFEGMGERRKIRELEGIIDIHSHILPGVDDGSESMEESMQMLEAADKGHIDRIIATPHFKGPHRSASKNTIDEAVRMLEKAITEKKYNIRIYKGNELLYRDDLPEFLEEGRASCLAGSRFILVEFNPYEEQQTIRSGMYRMISEGYIPILAHLERYNCFQRDIKAVQNLREMGVLIQVNAGSITGEFGLGTKMLCGKLLRENMVHFVATDAHRGKGHRCETLSACAQLIEKKYGTETAQRLLKDNPQKIIDNNSDAVFA